MIQREHDGLRWWECEGCGWKTTPSTMLPRVRHLCAGIPVAMASYWDDLQPREPHEVRQLAAICLACPLLRMTRHGARCTHKQCGCHGRETGVEPTIMHGIAFSPALVNLLTRRPSCPAGRW